MFATSTANFIVSFFSSTVIVEDSPVVPQTIMLSAPSEIWNSIIFLNSSKFTPVSVNGVIIAVPQPLKITFFIKMLLRVVNKNKNIIIFFINYITKKLKNK